jgi:hypothetical protein
MAPRSFVARICNGGLLGRGTFPFLQAALAFAAEDAQQGPAADDKTGDGDVRHK